MTEQPFAAPLRCRRRDGTAVLVRRLATALCVQHPNPRPSGGPPASALRSATGAPVQCARAWKRRALGVRRLPRAFSWPYRCSERVAATPATSGSSFLAMSGAKAAVRDASGEPDSRSIPDEQYRSVAGSRRCRRQGVADYEVSVGRQDDPGGI